MAVKQASWSCMGLPFAHLLGISLVHKQCKLFFLFLGKASTKMPENSQNLPNKERWGHTELAQCNFFFAQLNVPLNQWVDLCVSN